MDTLHKIAGVTGTQDETALSPPVPQETIAEETSSQHSLSRRGSRASLPLNRRRSGNNLGDTTEPTAPTLPSQNRSSNESSSHSEDFTWGPSHPCFPHPNPHCDPSSPEAQTTRVIKVKRDWLQAGDLYPQYANIYPEILDPLVSESEFRDLISGINDRLKQCMNPFTARAWMDAVLGVATGWVWEDAGLTGVKRGIKELERWMKEWNLKKERQGAQVRVVLLRWTGFMSLDFVIPDPGIDVGEEETRA